MHSPKKGKKSFFFSEKCIGLVLGISASSSSLVFICFQSWPAEILLRAGHCSRELDFPPSVRKMRCPIAPSKRTREEGGSHFPSLSLSLFPFAPETVKHKLNFLSSLLQPTAAKKAEKQTDGRTLLPLRHAKLERMKKDLFLGETQRTRGWANPYPFVCGSKTRRHSAFPPSSPSLTSVSLPGAIQALPKRQRREGLRKLVDPGTESADSPEMFSNVT